MAALVQEKCVACRADSPRCSDAEIAELHREVPEWELTEEAGIKQLRRSFRFPDFVQALAFTNHVGELAEAEGHHPRLVTEWGLVTVSWWTHAIRGLHRNDFIMAAKTDMLYRQHPLASVTAEINGIRLYYEVHGQGFPLVLLHGFAGTAQSWTPQIAALSARHRLILYDARGHWRSESPKDPRAYSQEIATEDLRALLDHLSLKRAIVGGLSMGGVVAMNFYHKYPERVRALILADTGPGFKNPAARESWNRARQEVTELLEREGVRAFADSPHAAQNSYTPREILLQLDPMGLAHTNSGLLTFHDSSLFDQIPSIAVPTLLIVGANDTDFVPATAYMQRKISGSELVVIEGAGHGSNVDQPEVFNQAVLDYLKRRLAD